MPGGRKSARRAAGSRASRPSRATTAEVVNGVRRLDRGLRLAAREVERATGMSAAGLFVLEQLVAEPDASIGDLAERTLTDRSSVSVIVDRLVAERLVTRVQSSGDRRRAEVRITKAGRRVLDRAPTAPAEMLVAALRRISASDVRKLGALLRTLNRKLGFEDAPLLFED
ncbi:MAG TPA: MarR family transcriptional regulator [Gemmatimonadaceae bacterium]|nr:MarR family transcriptional regulator [Gemmatimonadaceae bacterium]